LLHRASGWGTAAGRRRTRFSLPTGRRRDRLALLEHHHQRNVVGFLRGRRRGRGLPVDVLRILWAWRYRDNGHVWERNRRKRDEGGGQLELCEVFAPLKRALLNRHDARWLVVGAARKGDPAQRRAARKGLRPDALHGVRDCNLLQRSAARKGIHANVGEDGVDRVKGDRAQPVAPGEAAEIQTLDTAGNVNLREAPAKGKGVARNGLDLSAEMDRVQVVASVKAASPNAHDAVGDRDLLEGDAPLKARVSDVAQRVAICKGQESEPAQICAPFKGLLSKVPDYAGHAREQGAAVERKVFNVQGDDPWRRQLGQIGAMHEGALVDITRVHLSVVVWMVDHGLQVSAGVKRIAAYAHHVAREMDALKPRIRKARVGNLSKSLVFWQPHLVQIRAPMKHRMAQDANAVG